MHRICKDVGERNAALPTIHYVTQSCAILHATEVEDKAQLHSTTGCVLVGWLYGSKQLLIKIHSKQTTNK